MLYCTNISLLITASIVEIKTTMIQCTQSTTLFITQL